MPKADAVEVSTESRPYVDMIRQVREQASLEAGIAGGQDRAIELATQAIDRISLANDWEGIFSANEASALPGAEEASQAGNLTLQDVEFNVSQDAFKGAGSVGVYTFVTAVTEQGEEFLFTTGSTNVVMSLFHAQRKGILKGARIRIVQRGRMFMVGRPQ